MSATSLQLINIGLSADDHTGDTLYDGGNKINQNFTAIWTYTPVRHRQAILEYFRDSNGDPAYLTTSGLNVSILAPFVGSVMDSVSSRGELNVMIVLSSGVSNIATLSANEQAYLFAVVDPETGNITFDTLDTSVNTYTDSYIEPSSPIENDIWIDRINYRVVQYISGNWTQIYYLLIAIITAGNSTITSVEYQIDNEETIAMKKIAQNAALILG